LKLLSEEGNDSTNLNDGTISGEGASRREANERGGKAEVPRVFAHRPPSESVMKKELYDRVVAQVNRKKWWHVPPRDPNSYKKRGKIFDFIYKKTELLARRLDQPEKVRIEKLCISEKATIETALFGKKISDENIEMDKRFALDAKIKKAALAKDYDSIVLMAPKAFTEFEKTGKMPRSLELNIFVP
jgi:hypothetical protein